MQGIQKNMDFATFIEIIQHCELHLLKKILHRTPYTEIRKEMLRILTFIATDF
jgi:mevalonate pyrophosphate decarboxylase